MNDKDKSRAAKIGVFFGLLAIIFLSGLVTLGSMEIAKIREQLVAQENDRKILFQEISKLSPDKLSKEVASLINVKNGIDGQDGLDGKNGKDSLSTTTVIERQTVIEKELPPQNGKDGTNGVDGRDVEMAQSKNGVMLWRYMGDKEWQVPRILDIEVNLK